MKKINQITIARSLLLANLVSILVSTSLTSVTEILVYLWFLGAPEVRCRLWRVGRDNPMVKMALVWLAVVIVAAMYSIGSRADVIDVLGAWRKIFLLPLAAAVFDDEVWKRRCALTMVIATAIAMVVAYWSWGAGVVIKVKEGGPGVVLHNHATQGMFFSVAAFTAAVLAIRVPPRSALGRWGLWACSLLLAAHVVLITPGRSGYLSLLVVAAVFSVAMTKGSLRLALGIGVPVAVAVLIMLSPTARQRIEQGVHEMETYETSPQLTAMGVRVVMWKNTIRAIAKRPWLGAGTGGFSAAYAEQVKGVSGWQGEVVKDCHDQYMRIVAEQGVVGLLFFLAFVYSFWRQPVSGAARLIGLGVLVSWLATSLFSAHFSTADEGRFLYLFCGAMLAALPASQTR